MYAIIPIAGPDFSYDESSKALIQTKHGPFLKFILQSRPWYSQVHPSNYIFVLRSDPLAIDFFDKYLLKWFIGCKKVILSSPTRGAAFTVAAALSQLPIKLNLPIIVDLADIYFKMPSHNYRHIFSDFDFSAISFKSSLEFYSYFLVDKDNSILEAREKNVISSNASAGVYVFRNLSLFYEAFALILSNPHIYFYNGNGYIAPMLSAAKVLKKSSLLLPCSNVIDLKRDGQTITFLGS